MRYHVVAALLVHCMYSCSAMLRYASACSYTYKSVVGWESWQMRMRMRMGSSIRCCSRPGPRWAGSDRGALVSRTRTCYARTSNCTEYVQHSDEYLRAGTATDVVCSVSPRTGPSAARSGAGTSEKAGRTRPPDGYHATCVCAVRVSITDWGISWQTWLWHGLGEPVSLSRCV